MKFMTTIAASAVLIGLLTPAAPPAAAETVTLKRTGAQSRSDRAHSTDESGVQEESGGSASEPVDQADPAESAGDWPPSEDTAGDVPAPRAAKRRLIIGYDRSAHRARSRRHCVESFWSSCGERQRTLWVME